MVRLKPENDFDDKLFSLDDCEAKRIFALNIREERRLESERMNLEKLRAAEKKRLEKAQKDVVSQFIKSRKRSYTVKVRSYKNSTANSVLQPWTFSQKTFSVRSENCSTQKNTNLSKRNRFQKGSSDHSPHASQATTLTSSFSAQDVAEKNMSSEEERPPFCDIDRRWTLSKTRTKYFGFPHNIVSISMTERHPKRFTTNQDNFINKNSTEVAEERAELRKATCSFDIVPPAVLPSLYSKTEDSTNKEKLHGTLTRRNHNPKNGLWDGLENCRYIRAYTMKIK